MNKPKVIISVITYLPTILHSTSSFFKNSVASTNIECCIILWKNSLLYVAKKKLWSGSWKQENWRKNVWEKSQFGQIPVFAKTNADVSGGKVLRARWSKDALCAALSTSPDWRRFVKHAACLHLKRRHVSGRATYAGHCEKWSPLPTHKGRLHPFRRLSGWSWEEPGG